MSNIPTGTGFIIIGLFVALIGFWLYSATRPPTVQTISAPISSPTLPSESSPENSATLVPESVETACITALKQDSMFSSAHVEKDTAVPQYSKVDGVWGWEPKTTFSGAYGVMICGVDDPGSGVRVAWRGD